MAEPMSIRERIRWFIDNNSVKDEAGNLSVNGIAVQPDNDIARAAENGDLEIITSGQTILGEMQEEQLLTLAHLTGPATVPDFLPPTDFTRDFAGGERDPHKGGKRNISPADGHPMFYAEKQTIATEERNKGLFGTERNPMYTVDVPANILIPGSYAPIAGAATRLLTANEDRLDLVLMNSGPANSFVYFGTNGANGGVGLGFALGSGQNIKVAFKGEIWVSATGNGVCSYLESARVD